MINPKKYHAKILLFGEYSVLKGSDALALPFPKYGGIWQQTKDHENLKKSQKRLPEFAAYLNKKSNQLDYFDIDHHALSKALADGMIFESNIPTGYGLGSSGAVCAAIYDRFAVHKTTDPILLRQIFAMMESFFHGASSGFDPLVSYLNQAVRITQQDINILSQPPQTEGLFMIDTHQKRNANHYIDIFSKKCTDSNFNQKIRSALAVVTTKAIHAYINNDTVSLFHYMHDISRFQYFHLKEMIPPSIIPLWEKGLKSSFFKLKLCGAGGGGFMLGFCRDKNKIKNINFNVNFI